MLCWQPSILRVRASWDEVQNVSLTAEIEAPEWLLWGVDGSLHETLRVDLGFQGLRSDPPPQGYTASRTWDWDRRIFVRGVEAVSRVRVEQRVHPQTCSIYVVLVEDRVVAWTYIRNWALLCAFEAAELAPFEIARNGWVTTRGRSPVHLPLPIGRVCAVVGEGLPGPLLVPHSTSVGGYCYPFGKRVTDLVSLALPAAWAKMEGN